MPAVVGSVWCRGALVAALLVLSGCLSPGGGGDAGPGPRAPEPEDASGATGAGGPLDASGEASAVGGQAPDGTGAGAGAAATPSPPRLTFVETDDPDGVGGNVTVASVEGGTVWSKLAVKGTADCRPPPGLKPVAVGDTVRCLSNGSLRLLHGPTGAVLFDGVVDGGGAFGIRFLQRHGEGDGGILFVMDVVHGQAVGSDLVVTGPADCRLEGDPSLPLEMGSTVACAANGTAEVRHAATGRLLHRASFAPSHLAFEHESIEEPMGALHVVAATGWPVDWSDVQVESDSDTPPCRAPVPVGPVVAGDAMDCAADGRIRLVHARTGAVLYEGILGNIHYLPRIEFAQAHDADGVGGTLTVTAVDPGLTWSGVLVEGPDCSTPPSDAAVAAGDRIACAGDGEVQVTQAGESERALFYHATF